MAARRGNEAGQAVEERKRREGEGALAGGQWLLEGVAHSSVCALCAQALAGEGGTGALTQETLESAATLLAVGLLVVCVTLAEARLHAPVFASAYNWFAIP